ncbi:MAG TPA: exodeoxyribonuclease V subunit alpha [Lysobacter sp.]|nr:exodeoxyribonuclease V subunit alpha [Lysobacter sp.]
MKRTPGIDEHAGPRAVDLALADVLRRQDRARGVASDERVLLATALASLAISEGHAAFDPARPQLLLDDGRDWPAAGAWREALTQSPWVATPEADAIADASRPLALEHGLLYLRRYREYERRLAAGLRRLATQATVTGDLVALVPLFAQLFPQARDHDLQARAAALALVQSLLLITGGPGTGKTTTIARLLVLLTAQLRSLDDATSPRIALAAPTGRAAERMAQSLRDAVAQLRALGVDPALCDALPCEARTLHRLLGSMGDSPRFRHDGDSPRFRHDGDNPLPFDVIVIDEASMVDLPLMCKLVAAVPDGAQLILLGDRDQLPSVEAGDVLAAIVDAAGEDDTLPPELAACLAPLLGEPPAARTRAAVSAPGPQLQLALSFDAPSHESVDAMATALPLHGHRVHLRRGYRQSDALDLAPLAQAVRTGDAGQALALLRDGCLGGVHFHDGLSDLLAGPTRNALLAPWRELATLTEPALALQHATRQRVLTALREGAQGANQLNARIEEALAGAQREPYFHGRLLLVTENSYRHGLFNGDIGVCLRDADGTAVAWFAGSEGVRSFHPAALPAHTGAFAMTVHKAQGSEYDTVWLQLPRQDALTLSRELMYTALTRARHALHVCAGDAVLRAALSRHAVRVSGLACRLRDFPATPA